MTDTPRLLTALVRNSDYLQVQVKVWFLKTNCANKQNPN